MAAHYKIDDKKKIIIAESLSELTNDEERYIELLQKNEGYHLTIKKPASYKGSKLTKKAIEAKIKDKADLEEFQKLCKNKGEGCGFFAAKRFAKNKGYI